MGFEETLKTIVYLEKEKRYPTEWVKQYLENQFYIPEYESSCFNSLELFYRNYSTVYIYGAGVCGKNIAAYFDYKGWNFKGFISTEPEKEEVCSSCIEKVTIDSDTGIIVSVLNAEIAEEIAKHIGTRCSQNQLFYLSMQCNKAAEMIQEGKRYEHRNDYSRRQRKPYASGYSQTVSHCK